METLSPVKKFLIILFLLSANIYGQGSLKGIITDSLSNEALFGASAIIIGTSLGDATNIEGEYEVKNVPAGTHRLKISYVGYKTKIVDVNIKDNVVNHLNLTLVPAVVVGATVEVTAQALGQAAAINQQRTANTIINVVSEEKIKELPDANAAEAIGRLPGVSILRSGGEANKVILRGLSDQFTNFTIDGVKIPSTDSLGRGVDMSMISQSALAGIEVYKALTSDKDGDALAGSINLVTKKAPSKREIRFESKGDYNNLMKSMKQYDVSLHYGERFFNNFLGVQFTGNAENRIRSNEKIDLSYDQTINNQTDYVINDLKVEFTDETRKRNGASLYLDFNTPDEGTIRFNNTYSWTKRDYMLYTRNYPVNASNSSVSYSFRDREQEVKTFNSSITGNNNLLDLSINWGVSFAQSNSEFPYDYQIDFLEASSNISGMKANIPQLKSNPEQLVPYAWNNFAASSIYQAYNTTQSNLDKEKSAFINVAKDYLFGDLISGELKVGGKYKSKNRNHVNSQLYSPYYIDGWLPYTRLEDGSIVAKNLSGTSFNDFYQAYLKNPNINSISLSSFLDSNPGSRDLFDLYTMNPLISKDKLREWKDLNLRGVNQTGTKSEYNFDPGSIVNNYDITERVAAGYIMNTLNIGQSLTFIAGLRFENENNDYNSKYSPEMAGGFPIPAAVVRDTTANHKETVVLPNFHLNFKPIESLSIRLAAYKAIARPDFNYRLLRIFSWRPGSSSSNRQMYLGNPTLKTAKAWNFEINTSYYGNEIGLVSFSAFYKVIKDMYHMLNGLNTTGTRLVDYFGLKSYVPSKVVPSGDYGLYVPYNSPGNTKVWGFEFEHQINFVFLPGYLRNLVLSYNASLVKSETILIGSTVDTAWVSSIPGFPPLPQYTERVIKVKQQLENQPEFFGNISLGYDIGGLSARLSLFYQSEYNFSFTPSGRGDQVINGFTRLDFALKYKFTDYLSAMVNINNLTNIKDENSINNRVNGYKILNTSERYGLTADFGIKLDL